MYNLRMEYWIGYVPLSVSISSVHLYFLNSSFFCLVSVLFMSFSWHWIDVQLFAWVSWQKYFDQPVRVQTQTIIISFLYIWLAEHLIMLDRHGPYRPHIRRTLFEYGLNYYLSFNHHNLLPSNFIKNVVSCHRLFSKGILYLYYNYIKFNDLVCCDC